MKAGRGELAAKLHEQKAAGAPGILAINASGAYIEFEFGLVAGQV